MSVLKLAKIINTSKQASRKFQEERWKRGFGCVECGSVRAWRHRRLKNGLQKYRCEDCRHVFSDQSTTVLRWNKIKIVQVAIINYFSSSKLSIRELAKESQVDKTSVERLRMKIRKVKGRLYQSLGPPELSGTIEMDETKLSGRWLWGAYERGSGRAVMEFVADRSEFTLTRRIERYIEEGSTLLTDEWAGYRPPPRFYRHFTVNHSQTFVHPQNRGIHTNHAENNWKQIKRIFNHLMNGIPFHNIQTYLNDYFFTKYYPAPQKPTFFPLYCQKI